MRCKHNWIQRTYNISGWVCECGTVCDYGAYKITTPNGKVYDMSTAAKANYVSVKRRRELNKKFDLIIQARARSIGKYPPKGGVCKIDGVKYVLKEIEGCFLCYNRAAT